MVIFYVSIYHFYQDTNEIRKQRGSEKYSEGNVLIKVTNKLKIEL